MISSTLLSAGIPPVFYDFEASSLDGYPIEIGWAWWDGNDILSESHLILPDPIWDIESSWDEQAQALHGITLEQLCAEGEAAFDIARRMNVVLTGHELFADSPIDVGWMTQLYEVAGLDPAFQLRLMLAPVLIDRLRTGIGMSEEDASAISDRVKHEFPHTHRAEADARQWAEIWRAMVSRSPRAL